MKINEQFLEVRLEVEKSDAGYCAKVSDYTLDEMEAITFTSPTKKALKKQVKQWVKEIIETEDYKKLKTKEYAIEIDVNALLKSFKHADIGYHISGTENQSAILLQGLIPNKVIDETVYRPNCLVDKQKPETIQKDFQKSESVYLHTTISNNLLFEPGHYKNSTLFAVDTTGLDGYVGSIGLSGFLLFDDEEELKAQEFNEGVAQEIEDSLAKLYWAHVLSIQDYKEKKQLRKKIEKEYGLDEILISKKIEPDRICLMGHWDNEGVFHFGDHFDYFVKEQAPQTKEEIKKLYP